MYSPPSEGDPQSNIRFVTLDGLPYSVILFGDKGCAKTDGAGMLGAPGSDMKKLINIPARSAPQHVQQFGNSLLMPFPPKTEEVNYIERRVPAKNGLTFLIYRIVSVGGSGRIISTQTCEVAFTMDTQSGANYEVGFYFGDKCSLEVSEIFREDSHLKKGNRGYVSGFHILDKSCDLI